MKNLLVAFSIFSIALGLASCKQDAPQPKSIYDVLLEQEDLTFLRAAISHAGLNDAFKTSSLTLFAPTDDGFKAAGFADAAAITSMTPRQVQNLLKNHVITQKQTVETTSIGLLNPTQMMSGARLFVSNVDRTLYLNQAKASKMDLVATNGVVHIINRAILPPHRTLGQIVAANPNFSLFREALLRARQSDPRLTVFTDTSSRIPVEPAYTMFIPTNQAMEATGLTSTVIANTSPILLARRVSYHIALSRFFSSLAPTGNLAMFDASFVTRLEAKNGALTITEPSRPTTPAKATQVDITATNGIIHIIDRVLTPQ
ncbi:MAG: fasciclin domain-containing protein [Runella sp.]